MVLEGRRHKKNGKERRDSLQVAIHAQARPQSWWGHSKFRQRLNMFRSSLTHYDLSKLCPL